MSAVAADAPRLDVWLASDRDITRHAAQTLIDAGLVSVNGRRAKASYRVRADDMVRVADAEARDVGGELVPATASTASAGPAIAIVYEDEWLAVVDKPAGLVVHPAPGHATGTLVDALKARGSTWSLLGGAERAGIVHRLDRDTSGLLVVAKTESAHRALAGQLSSRSLGRAYVAIVQGGFREDSGTIDAPVGRDRRDRKRMSVTDGGRAAITDFRVAERLGTVTRLDVHLRTGRTHQIRAHMAYIKHPVCGDPIYGRGGAPGRPALHAAELTFVHPLDQTRRTFTSPLPGDLAAYLGELRGRAG